MEAGCPTHLLGISTSTGPVLLEIDLKELTAHGLDLLLRHRAYVKCADDGAHVLGGLDGGQAGDSSSQDQNLGGRNLPSSSHLASEKPSELVTCLDYGTVASNVGLTGKSVERLAPREGPRDAVHGKDGGLLVLELLHQVRVLRGPDEAQEGPILDKLGLLGRGGPNLENNVLLKGLLA